MLELKCFTKYASKFGQCSSSHRTQKGQFSFQSQRKAMPKNAQTALISHPSKVMLKLLQARLQEYPNHELLDIQAGFRKGRGARDQIANIHWIIKNAREFQKNIYFCLIDYTKVFDCVDHNKLWKILEEMRLPDHLTGLQRNLYAGQETLEPDMEQHNGSKLGKEYDKAVYCHPAYLITCRVHHEKCWAGRSISWNQDCREKYQ